MSMYDKIHYNIVISLQLIKKINGKKKKKKYRKLLKKKKDKGIAALTGFLAERMVISAAN